MAAVLSGTQISAAPGQRLGGGPRTAAAVVATRPEDSGGGIDGESVTQTVEARPSDCNPAIGIPASLWDFNPEIPPILESRKIYSFSPK